MEAALLPTQRANRARSHDLGISQGKRAALYLGADAEQGFGGQALGSIRKALWRRLRGTHTQLDESDQKQ
jgi:hypothetical protein